MYATPGLLTDQALSETRLRELVAAGYEWISYQTQNGSATFDYDLSVAKKAGFKNVGVWGVSYHASEVAPNAYTLGAQAKRLGAQHQMADLEEFFKNTRGVKVGSTGKTLGQFYIEGVRNGLGQPTAAVHLTTLSNPTNPVAYDYAMDTQPFIDSGGGLFGQAYLVEDATYTPANCVTYWKRFVPLERINIMIGLYEKNGVRVSGETHVPLLREAAARRNISIFMAQHATAGDLAALRPFSVVVDPAAQRQKIVEEADAWLLQQLGLQPKSRLRAIRRIAMTDDATWVAERDGVIAALDILP